MVGELTFFSCRRKQKTTIMPICLWVLSWFIDCPKKVCQPKLLFGIQFSDFRHKARVQFRTVFCKEGFQRNAKGKANIVEKFHRRIFIAQFHIPQIALRNPRHIGKLIGRQIPLDPQLGNALSDIHLIAPFCFYCNR